MHIWNHSFHPLENRNIDLSFLRSLWVNIKLLSIITLFYFHYFVFVSDHFFLRSDEKNFVCFRLFQKWKSQKSMSPSNKVNAKPCFWEGLEYWINRFIQRRTRVDDEGCWKGDRYKVEETSSKCTVIGSSSKSNPTHIKMKPLRKQYRYSVAVCLSVWHILTQSEEEESLKDQLLSLPSSLNINILIWIWNVTSHVLGIRMVLG